MHVRWADSEIDKRGGQRTNKTALWIFIQCKTISWLSRELHLSSSTTYCMIVTALFQSRRHHLLLDSVTCERAVQGVWGLQLVGLKFHFQMHFGFLINICLHIIQRQINLTEMIIHLTLCLVLTGYIYFNCWILWQKFKDCQQTNFQGPKPLKEL